MKTYKHFLLAGVVLASLLLPLEAGPKEDADLYNTVGLKALAAGDSAKAEEQFRKALRLYPAHVGATGGLAGIIINQGDVEGLVRIYRDYLKAFKKVLPGPGDDEFRGKVEHALTCITELEKLDKKYARKFVSLGKSLKHKDMDAATEAYRIALDLDPSNRNAKKWFKKAGGRKPKKQKMFNGKDLSGFSKNSGFSVDKGTLVGSPDGPAKPAFLAWDRAVDGDFEFSVSVRRENSSGRDMLRLIYGQGTQKSFVFTLTCNESKYFMSRFHDSGIEELKEGPFKNPLSKWTKIKLRLKGSKMTVWIGGRLLDTCDTPIYKGGKIGLTIYYGRFRFKDLLYSEPVGDKPGRHKAPRDGSVFNGKDLSTFIVESPGFKVEEGLLVADDQGGPTSPTILWKQRLKGNFEFSTKVRMVSQSSGCVLSWYFGWISEKERFLIHFNLATKRYRVMIITEKGRTRTLQKGPLNETLSSWSDIKLKMRGSTLTVYVNGGRYVSCGVSGYRGGKIGISVLHGKFQFKDLAVKGPTRKKK